MSNSASTSTNTGTSARHPLSTVQEFRGIVHIMPYGYLNQSTGSMGMSFYRCATSFDLDIRTADIDGTPLASRLAPYMTEPGPAVEEKIRFLHKTAEKKALLIDYLFPILDKLAPQHAREWNTVEDVIATPKYRLSLHRPETNYNGGAAGYGVGVGDVIARIDKGPIITPALDILQARLDTSTLKIADQNFLANLPQIPASDITFTGPVESNSVPTSVVVPPAGEVVQFIPAGRFTQNMDIKRTSNPSHFAIRTYLEIQRLLANHSAPSLPSSLSGSRAVAATTTAEGLEIGVQEFMAIVTTQTPPPSSEQAALDAASACVKIDDSSTSDATTAAATTSESPPPVEASIEPADPTTYLAGILLKPLPPDAKALENEVTIRQALANPSVNGEWHAAVLSTLEGLHAHTPPLYHGNISPRTIYVCPPPHVASGLDRDIHDSKDNVEGMAVSEKTRGKRVYLVDFTDNRSDERFTPRAQVWTPEGDIVAVEKIFGHGGWLRTKMEKLREQ